MKIFVTLFFAAFVAAAETPKVPTKMHFAGMTLTIRDDARREIQKDVDALMQSPKHFLVKVERAKTYFPIIEKILQEERVPDDFKFLVLQESALIADAVSVSNAVGFWQFKDFTAVEVGLRVDRTIDERMNIVSSTRGAARYIKKNNFHFNNWIYALQAYQMGAGAVLQTVKNTEGGTKHMEVTSQTYWYVKKFLAHKIAFEEAVRGEGQFKVITYDNRKEKTLPDLAKEFSANEAELIELNKWVRAGTIPNDRTYAVVVPATGTSQDIILYAEAEAAKRHAETKKIHESKSSAAPVAVKGVHPGKINSVPVIIAVEGESVARLADRAQVDLSDFMNWNDVSISDKVVAGQYYFLGKKKSKGLAPYHKVLPGENLWLVSQKYGVKLSKLERYNRLTAGRTLEEGEMLWLTATKPKESESLYTEEAVELEDQSFSWGLKSNETVSAQLSAPPMPSIDKPEVSTATEVRTGTEINTDTVSVENLGEHTVKTGETLYAIAKDYNMGVMDLVSLNNLRLEDGIKPGQVLKVSDYQIVANNTIPTTQTQEVLEHEVKPTDTLYSVARKYGVTIKDLMDWNDKKDFTLSVGEKLRILHQ